MIWLSLGIVAIFTGALLLYGAPYVPSKKSSIALGLDLLDLKKGQKLIDLGSGDGAVLIQASKRGINGTGYEINPVLWLISRLLTLNNPNVAIHLRNFHHIDIPNADGVYIFQAGPYMKRVSRIIQKIADEHHAIVKVVSVGFELPGLKIVKSKNGLLLYKVAPKVAKHKQRQ